MHITKQAALVFAEVEAIIDAVPEFAQFRIKATSFWKRMEVKAGPGKGTVYAVLSGEKEARSRPSAVAVDLSTSSALHRTGSCSTRCRRQAASATGRSASLSRRKLRDDRHPFSQLIDDAVKNKDPSIVVQLHCCRR